MNKNLKQLDSNSIDKAFRKYILEVDDTIEAHGFKITSCIDYAEDSISDLKDSLKEDLNNSSFLFANLENSLNETISKIVTYTKEDAISRNNYLQEEKLNKKTSQLHNSLINLSPRLFDSLYVNVS